MPLVQRTSKQGNLFKQDDEPAQWENADLWADSNSNPRRLFINNAGTALELGVFSEGDASLTSSVDATGTPQNVSLIATWGNGSEAVTITNSTNKVCLCASGYTANTLGAESTTVEIKQSTTVLASVTEAYLDNAGALCNVMHVEDDVTDATTFTSLVSGGQGGGSVLTYQVFE